MSDKQLMGAIAATRFGLGARAGEIAEAARDPLGWVLAQTTPEAAPAWVNQPHSSELLNDLRSLELSQPDAELRRPWYDGTVAREQRLRIEHAATTSAPFRERWAMFWRNHFALTIGGPQVDLLAGAFAREVVDAHLFGRFEDMAVAAAQHPAMQGALDQIRSVGPNSPVGLAGGRGLNENLARETLELHTLGVHGGYSQRDVTELARALTGWTVAEPLTPAGGRFVNDAARREPGVRRVLGRDWPESDDRAERIVRALARNPATAAHVAAKLARHFTADQPPPALVERLRATFLGTEGDLRAVAKALIESPECWVREQRKFKSPVEFVTSVHRAVGHLPDDAAEPVNAVQAMGQAWLWARTPAGWSDEAVVWATPQGLALRAGYAWTHAHRSGADGARGFGKAALGRLTRRETTAALLNGAGLDRPSGFALIAMSPEFQRR
jgi:uncharacterized protein (DUF1800 family)